MAADARVVWRLGIPRETLGTVIGKAGSTIHRLETQSECTITIRTIGTSRRQESVATMSGTLNQCLSAAAAVAYKFTEVTWRKTCLVCAFCAHNVR